MKINLLRFSPFILIFCLFLFIASGRIESSDGISAVNVARNVITQHDFSMSPPSLTNGLQTTKGKDGKYYSPTGLGISLAYVPSVILTKLFYSFHHGDFAKKFPLEYDFMLTFLASFVNPVLGFFLFYIDYRIFLIILKSRKQSFLLSFLISFTTNLLPLTNDSFSHILFNLSVMSSFYFILRFYSGEKKYRNIIWSGVMLGIGIISYNLVYILFIGLLTGVWVIFLKKLHYDWKQIVTKIFIWLVILLPFIMLVFWFNYVRFGSILTTGYDPNTYDLRAKGVVFEGIWGLLLSPGKSIFIYSPLLMLSFYYAIKYIRKDWSGQFLLILTGILVIFYSRFVFWSGDISWGPRYLSIIIPFAGLPLAYHFKEFMKTKLFLILLLLFSLFVQFEGVTIPSDREYRIYDFTVFSMPKNVQRVNQFDYWSIGQFIPRYAPIYNLKKDVVKNLIIFTQVLRKKGPITIAKHASLPLRDSLGVSYKNGKSLMYLYSTKNLLFATINFDVQQLPYKIKSAQICTRVKCWVVNKIHQDSLHVDFTFSNSVEIPSKQYFSIQMYSDTYSKGIFDFKLYGLKIGDNIVSMKDYSLANLDSYLLRDTILFFKNAQRGYFEENNFYRYEVVNTVPDIWWIRHLIYFNDPIEINIFFNLLLAVTLVSIVGTIFNFKMSKEKIL